MMAKKLVLCLIASGQHACRISSPAEVFETWVVIRVTPLNSTKIKSVFWIFTLGFILLLVSCILQLMFLHKFGNEGPVCKSSSENDGMREQRAAPSPKESKQSQRTLRPWSCLVLVAKPQSQ